MWLLSSVDSFRPCELGPARPLSLWDSRGKNVGVGGLALLQGILPTQRSNPRLLSLWHWQDSFFLEGGFFTTLLSELSLVGQ